jgi:hypothetical protein
MVIPRFIWLSDASKFLGMSEPNFDKKVRPDIEVINENRPVLYIKPNGV